jgi:hypothetical protein
MHVQQAEQIACIKMQQQQSATERRQAWGASAVAASLGVHVQQRAGQQAHQIACNSNKATR